MLAQEKKLLQLAAIGFTICFLCTVLVQIIEIKTIYQNSIYQQKQYIKNTVENDIKYIDLVKKDVEKRWSEEKKFYSVSDVKAEVTRIVRQKLYSEHYSNDGYVWINEVRDYDGGDGYAIRLIHPNLKDTEGIQLSTRTKDAKGNLPYKEELEGIKKDGHISYSYYFEELKSKKISKKMSYAAIYKEYNWIVCMGVYYTQIKENSNFFDEKAQVILGVGYAISISGIVIVLWNITDKLRKSSEKYKHEAEDLQNKVEEDALTKACSRYYGTILLKKELERYKRTNKSAAIAILDVDHFKNINDMYGHNFGDEMLKSIVSEMKNHIRETDSIIRWGGDEFIIVLRNTPSNCLEAILQKLNKLIRVREVVNEDNIGITTTISIGAGYFIESDEDIEDLISRIDVALYEAKKKRDTYQIIKGQIPK